jgi:C4-dicarboxylate-specific signal transduction histidine kinase/CheY-like chemotaxis protein
MIQKLKQMLDQPIVWGLLCGSLYFLVMWRIRSRRLTEQRDSTRALYSLSEEIVASNGTADLVSKLEARLPDLVRASSAHVFLADRGARCLTHIATPTHPEAFSVGFDGDSHPIGKGLMLCYRNRTPLMIADSLNNSLVANADGNTPRTLLLIPLVSHEEALGVIQVDRGDQSGPFSSEDQAAVQHVANQVASALKLQEQQSLREQLFRGEKLAATGTMISGIAVELKSPIEAISKLSVNLMETLKRRDDIPTVEVGLARVVGEAAKAQEIVGRMTSFTRDGDSAPRELDLNATLQKLTRNRESLWSERGLASEIRLTSGSLPLLGAEGQLEQVLLTFLLYVEARAAESVSRAFFVKTAETAGQLRVELGYAAPATDAETEEPVTTSEDGGLSLDVCGSILRTHGGDLKIHRRTGVFAFEIILPSVNRVVDTVRRATVPLGRALTLMVVDPEPAANRALLRLLSSRGHRVVPVAGEEAAEVAPRLHFDAVFWAARPGRTGWGEFLERVRASIGSFVVISDGYNQELASSLEKNGGYLLSRPLEENSLDRILVEIDGRSKS